MKIIHTSDWHLGQNFYGYDRHEEHAAFLQQLRRIVAEQQPDALVVSGDIFHNYNPSAAAMRLYTDSLVAIHHAAPAMTIVVIAGNHDSASRLDVDRTLWQLAGVHVVGCLPQGPDGPDFEQMLIPVPGKGLIMAVPYVFNQAYPAVPGGGDPRQHFFAQAASYVRQHNPQGLPVVLMAHLAVAGSDLHGQRIKGMASGIGGLDLMPLGDFDPAFDYVALGHIHHPQTLAGSEGRVRYSGSPVAVSFDEDYPHTVTLATLEHGQQPQLHFVEIDNPCPLLTIPAKPAPVAQAIAALRELTPAQGPCYVRLNPQAEFSFGPSMEQDAINALQEVNPQARYTTFVPNFTAAAPHAAQADFTPDQLAHMEPADVARQFCKMNGRDFDKFKDMLQQAIDEINKEDAK